MQFSRLTAPASCAALLLAGCGAGSDGGLALAGTTTISNGLPTSMVALPAN